MRCKRLGQIKIALAGTDTSSLLEILQVHFGHAASSESDEEEGVLMEEKKTSEAIEEVVAEPKEVGNLATAELVFPFKSSPLVAGIPKMYLPLHGPETLSCYHCQVSPVPLILPKRQLLVITFVMTI